MVPDDARTKPTPAIICVHSTTWGSGKDQVVGLSGRRPVDPPGDPQVGADYGRTLARHGFVTLSIDLLTDGERIDPEHRVMDTLEYYDSQHQIPQQKIERQLGEFGAGDCFSWFSFPGGHGFPGVTRRMTFAWFDRWLGRTLK